MDISLEQKITELKESLEHIGHFLELIKEGKPSYVKPLSVELRKIHCKGTGNELLSRIGTESGVDIKFPIRTKPHIPPTFIDAPLDNYLDEFRFFQEGEEYTRRDVIHLIADKKDAHLDEKEKPFHKFEKVTFLPLGHPNTGGSFPLGTKYLVDIAQTSLDVVSDYINALETPQERIVK